MVQAFLQQELSREKLSQGCEAKRQTINKSIESIVKKIRHAHPSIRPRVNTPGGIKKPAPPPPLDPPSVPSLPEGGEEGELYEEAQQAEDYLSFEPTHSQEDDQEMYVDVGAEQQDVYEEPGR